MPSLTHEAIVQLLREHPVLAAQLLAMAGVEVPEYDEIRVESSDLTQSAPTEYRADLVILLVQGKPVLAIVVEVQLSRDRRKRERWPVYVTTVHAAFHCPACLLIVTADPAIERWAAKTIQVGPGMTLVPVVLGPSAIAAIEDPEMAKREPELAVLSAMAHGHDRDAEAAARVALAAIMACLGLDNEAGLFYVDVVRVALGAAARRALESLMQSPQHREFQSEFARKYVALGRAEGEAQGVAQGLAQGRSADILRLLERRDVRLTKAQRERIATCTDLALLETWFDRAITATKAAEVFG